MRLILPLILVLCLSPVTFSDHHMISLLDGKTTSGWVGMNEAGFEADPETGVLRLNGGMGWIRSEQIYSDFILEMDIRPMSEGFDSGIYFRAGLEGDVWPSEEYQVNLRYNRYGWLVKGYSAMVEGTGFEADLEEWNHFKLHVEGRNATLWIDDEVQWETSELIPGSGFIGFQAEKFAFEFKNIRIQELGYDNLLEGEGPIGESLKIYGGPEDVWSIEDGVLVCQGDSGGWIGTIANDYGDFDLKFDYNVPRDGNSGVFIRYPGEGSPAFDGMEIQIIDDNTLRWGELQPWQLSGSIYREMPPSVRATRPGGEWQSMQIICSGSMIIIRINGITVVDVNVADFVNSTEEDITPLNDRPREGIIGFQNYDGRMAFRNMRIKRL